MEELAKLEIEVVNGAKDLDFLKNIDKSLVEELSLFIFKPISLRFLKDFTGLKNLMISGSVKDFRPLTDCISLKSLYLSGGTIDSLEFLADLSLTSLTLENFRSNVAELHIPELHTLQEIKLSKVAKIADLAFLSSFAKLNRINLFELNSKKLFDFTPLKNLRFLEICNMFHLKDFNALKTLGHLDLLSIKYFFVNRQLKIDVEKELMKVVEFLPDVKVIQMDVNEKNYLYQNE